MASDIIQSVDRALEFLIYLYNEGKETSVTQIANDLGVYKSTVFRTLTTMEARGFVKKNPETEKYWLEIAFLRWERVLRIRWGFVRL